MQQQVFRATRFEDAMAQVRAALGSDALIVSRKQLRKMGGLYSGGPLVEITAVSAQHAADAGIVGAKTSAAERLRTRLVRGGVPEGPARAVATRMREELSVGRRGPDAERSALMAALAVEMMFAPAVGSAARVAVFLGPTGAGKTTTIAKLAARAALVDRRKVGLVSLDQYRVGGVEQLQKYAELIGIQLEVATDGPSLCSALGRLERAELVFVDTAGRSPRDLHAVGQLAQCLLDAQVPMERYLCLPVAMRNQEIAMLLSLHAALEPSRLVSTKADEAVCCSGIVAAQASSGLPVAYVTTGQRVPEDIEPASPEVLAHLLSGSEIGPS